MMGQEGSLEALGAYGAPFFPLFWKNDLVAITRYDKKYLALDGARIVCLLGKFEVMDSLTIIRFWLEGGDHPTAYLGKFWIPHFLL